MTLEEAVRKLDELGHIGQGDPECAEQGCESCQATLALREFLDQEPVAA